MQTDSKRFQEIMSMPASTRIEKLLRDATFNEHSAASQVAKHKEKLADAPDMLDWFKWSEQAIEDAARYRVWKLIKLLLEEAVHGNAIDVLKAQRRMESYESTALSNALSGHSTSPVNNEVNRKLAYVWTRTLDNMFDRRLS